MNFAKHKYHVVESYHLLNRYDGSEPYFLSDRAGSIYENPGLYPIKHIFDWQLEYPDEKRRDYVECARQKAIVANRDCAPRLIDIITDEASKIESTLFGQSINEEEYLSFAPWASDWVVASTAERELYETSIGIPDMQRDRGQTERRNTIGGTHVLMAMKVKFRIQKPESVPDYRSLYKYCGLKRHWERNHPLVTGPLLYPIKHTFGWQFDFPDAKRKDFVERTRQNAIAANKDSLCIPIFIDFIKNCSSTIESTLFAQSIHEKEYLSSAPRALDWVLSRAAEEKGRLNITINPPNMQRDSGQTGGQDQTGESSGSSIKKQELNAERIQGRFGSLMRKVHQLARQSIGAAVKLVSRRE